jgi:hypothetical protein
LLDRPCGISAVPSDGRRELTPVHVRRANAVSASTRRLKRRIARDHSTAKVDALLRLEVACRLAAAALPHLPPETEEMLREHVQVLRDVTRAELDQIRPGSRAAMPDLA